ncbi:MAG TPA: GAF domain-containing protein [Vicinamibacterales bacterium]|nr:GAF domain-containing protein [Vicinamibacterales bacterium]
MNPFPRSPSGGAEAAASLAAPADHRVKFYADDPGLIEGAAAFLAEGLRAGDAAMVVGTAEHREAIRARLEAEGVLRPGASPPVLFVDAEETLATFMRGEAPDRALFQVGVGGMVAAHAAKASSARVRVFGEMVNILWESGYRDAALQLEALWNELQRVQPFSLLCGYAVGRFEKEPAALRAVCRVHTQAANHTDLDTPVDEASTALAEEIAHRREVERALRDSMVEVHRRDQDRRRGEEQSARLLKVSGAIADAVTPDQVYEAIVDHVATAVDASTAGLWLIDGSTVKLVRSVGYSDAAARQFAAVDLDLAEPFPALDAIRRNAAIWIPSQEELLRQYPHIGPVVTRGRAYRVTCLPLLSQGRAVGALGVTLEAEGQASDGEREFLLLVARYASQAIERLRLLDAERAARVRTEELYGFAQAVMAATRVEQVFEAAMNAIHSALGADRSSILIADAHGVMRFRAWRNLSDPYRRAVDGHSPWPRDAVDPQPVLVSDIQTNEAFAAYRDVFAREGLGALAFVPLVNAGHLLGKFMVYYDTPHIFVESEIETAKAIANHLASVTARFAAMARLEETIHYNELFAGVLAHDLRSPLSAILTAAQVGLISMEQHGTASAAPARPFGRILTSGQRMSRMIDQLLDLTIARSRGQFPVHPRPTNLKDLCADAVAEMELAQPDWRISLETTGDLIGTWDPDRLLQVASNLLANAGQHGKPGVPIVIRLDGTATGAVRLEVQNSGAVPASILTTVFDPFQAVRRRGDRSRGLGLGLFIVRELITSHGGTVEIESSDQTDATVVRVQLPRHAEGQPLRPSASA